MSAVVLPVRYVKPDVFERLTGYTTLAVEKKIQRGVWIIGKQYKKAPDGNILVDLLGYQEWVEGK